MKLFRSALLLCGLFMLVACGGKTITYTFVDSDDTVIEIIEAKVGESITAPIVEDNDYYIFKGWDKEFADAKENITIKAVYEKRTFQVTFNDSDGTLIEVVDVLYLEDAVAPEVTTPTGYQLAGWDKPITGITGNQTVTAIYEKKLLTVTFQDYDGKVLKSVSVFYGEEAEAPADPLRDGFEFSGWDKEFTSVIDNLVVKAKYTQTRFNINYYDGTKKITDLTPNVFEGGELVVLPIPTKENHEFIGWFPASISLARVEEAEGFYEDITFYAKWVATALDNPIILPESSFYFTTINKNPHSSGTGFVYQPVMPALAPSPSVLQYTWETSDPNIAKVSAYSSLTSVSTGYCVLSAIYNADTTKVIRGIIKVTSEGIFASTVEEANDVKYHLVTFNDLEGALLKKQYVADGGFAIPPVPPVVEGKLFGGWVGGQLYGITAPITFSPLYYDGTGNYSGKKVSIIGDSIATYASYVPDGFSTFYPYPSADVGDINHTWWMQVINKFGMQLLVNNSYSGSCVYQVNSSSANTVGRINYSSIGGYDPDIIIISMGQNDCASAYITHAQFSTAYAEMIDKIEVRFPNAEIILCTLPSLKMYSEENKNLYNATILDIATANSFKVIDFAVAFNKDDLDTLLCDSAHPLRAGMDKMASVAINNLLEYYHKVD